MKKEFPIIEFDENMKAFINPKPYHDVVVSEYCVLCFFQNVIDKLKKEKKIKPVTHLNTEMGKHHVYEYEFNGKSITLAHPGIGAPLAAGLMEELIALGCKKIIACGGAGVLKKNIGVGDLLVPTSAIRDEGTSYHYIKPAREISADPNVVKSIELVLDKHDINYSLVKTWTTDAFYRETVDIVNLRKDEGAFCVEMETAAFLAVAKFRNVKFGQILYGGDDLSGEYWDNRDWQNRHSIREKLVELSAEICLEL